MFQENTFYEVLDLSDHIFNLDITFKNVFIKKYVKNVPIFASNKIHWNDQWASRFGPT